MGGKTPKEAVDNFIYYLRETLSCIVADDLTAFQQSTKLHKVYFDSPATVSTLAGKNLYVSVTQIFTVGEDKQITGEYKVSTREYSYVLSQEPHFEMHGVLSYHWHPNEFAVRFPHLHLKITPRTGYPEIERRIRNAHYPTSRVCLEDFVFLLIRYYDIKPRLVASEWPRILKKNKRAFDLMATWK